MRLQELEPETIADYYLKWASGNPVFKHQTDLLAYKKLKIKPDSPEAMLAALNQIAQEITNKIKAPYFAQAVKDEEWNLFLKDLGGEEAVRQFVEQFVAYMPLPPGALEVENIKEELIKQVKTQSDLLMGSFQGTTVGEIAEEINKALEICEKIGVEFEIMLIHPDFTKQYLRLRYTKEEFRQMSENRLELALAQMWKMGMIQLEQLAPQPTVSIDDPRYIKQLRQIERKKRLIKYQMERRFKKLRKFARKRLKQFLNDVWGK